MAVWLSRADLPVDGLPFVAVLVCPVPAMSDGSPAIFATSLSRCWLFDAALSTAKYTCTPYVDVSSRFGKPRLWSCGLNLMCDNPISSPH